MEGKGSRLTFGGFVLDCDNVLLWRGEDRVALAPKPFGVLCHLAQRAGELVAKDELLEAVWPNLHVTESSLTVSINAIRLALGDNSRAPRYVETVTRRGYRFIAPVSRYRQRDQKGQRALSGRADIDAGARADQGEPGKAPPGPRADCRVGRESALATMERWFEEAARGERRLAFVAGEAGIGKTTFVEMLFERMAGRRVGILVGRCIQHFGGDEAFLPINEAFAAACGGRDGPLLLAALRQHAPTWLAQLPGAIAGRDSAALKGETFGASRERMLREFCELLEALSAERPWIVVIEDLHWGDYASLDVLSRFAHRNQGAAALMIATYRPADARAGGHPVRTLHQELQIHGRCVELTLSKLSVSEIGRYLVLRFGAADLASALAPALARRTGGNPLFVASLVDYFVAQGEIVEGEGGWRLAPGASGAPDGMPEDLHEMIARRIDRLSRIEQRLLEAASALGADFSAAAVAGGVKRDAAEVDQALEELARKGEVLNAEGVAEWPDGTRAGRYAFAHTLYQEVLYERLAPVRRAVLHRLLGETLEWGYEGRTSEIAAALTLHFEEGGEFAKAAHYLAEAADASTKRFGAREADAYLSRALGLVERLPAGNTRLTARMKLLHQRGWARRAGGDLPGAFADIAATVACAEEAGEPLVEVHGLLDLSRFSLYVDRRRCLDYAELALIRGVEVEDEIVKALARGNMGNLSLLLRGWSGDDAERCREALRILANSNDPLIQRRGCSIEAVVQFLSSDYRACRLATTRGQELAQAIGDVFYASLLNVVEAFAHLYLGEWRLLLTSASEALAMAERNANSQAAVLCQLSIAWLHAQALDYAGAKRRAEAALNPAIERNPFNFFFGRALLAKTSIGLRDYEGADTQFRQIADKIEIEGIAMDATIYPEYFFDRTEYFIETGDLPRARAQALELHLIAARPPERTYLALSYGLLAKIARREGDVEEARRRLAQAIAIVEASETPLAAWRIFAWAAAFYEGVGELAEAAAAWARCEAIIAGLLRGFDDADPLRGSLLENYAAEARRGAPAVRATRNDDAPPSGDENP
jgi:DNA-binding winged helix-turn-helix (wHTH) protein